MSLELKYPHWQEPLKAVLLEVDYGELNGRDGQFAQNAAIRIHKRQRRRTSCTGGSDFCYLCNEKRPARLPPLVKKLADHWLRVLALASRKPTRIVLRVPWFGVMNRCAMTACGLVQALLSAGIDETNA